MIPILAAAAAGAAAGAWASWYVAARRADARDLEVMGLWRNIRQLRAVNTRLSRECGHCGAARTPAEEAW
ncbi:MAG TPA: hypothetical protein VKZ89_06770 [Thermobifida alba]|nr:hypothetical protein [Thermobifida alba]